MQNRQKPETIRNWMKAGQIVSDRLGNICRCGSLLDREHMTECRLFRLEVSKVFRELEFNLKQEVTNR